MKSDGYYDLWLSVIRMAAIDYVKYRDKARKLRLRDPKRLSQWDTETLRRYESAERFLSNRGTYELADMDYGPEDVMRALNGEDESILTVLKGEF